MRQRKANPVSSSPSENLLSSFSGVFTALVTPFLDDGGLDEAGLRRLHKEFFE